MDGQMTFAKDDDKTKAQQRKRICVITQRMTCCLMLCKVCETLIQKHVVRPRGYGRLHLGGVRPGFARFR